MSANDPSQHYIRTVIVVQQSFIVAQHQQHQQHRHSSLPATKTILGNDDLTVQGEGVFDLIQFYFCPTFENSSLAYKGVAFSTAFLAPVSISTSVRGDASIYRPPAPHSTNCMLSKVDLMCCQEPAVIFRMSKKETEPWLGTIICKFLLAVDV